MDEFMITTWPDAFQNAAAAIAIAAIIIAYWYFKHKQTQRRLELIHQERLAAMDKGIPLPELPLDPPPAVGSSRDPRALLIHGVIWTSLSLGTMAWMATLQGRLAQFALAPVPLLFLGVGLLLLHFLTRNRER